MALIVFGLCLLFLVGNLLLLRDWPKKQKQDKTTLDKGSSNDDRSKQHQIDP